MNYLLTILFVLCLGNLGAQIKAMPASEDQSNLPIVGEAFGHDGAHFIVREFADKDRVYFYWIEISGLLSFERVDVYETGGLSNVSVTFTASKHGNIKGIGLFPRNPVKRLLDFDFVFRRWNENISIGVFMRPDGWTPPPIKQEKKK